MHVHNKLYNAQKPKTGFYLTSYCLGREDDWNFKNTYFCHFAQPCSLLTQLNDKYMKNNSCMWTAVERTKENKLHELFHKFIIAISSLNGYKQNSQLTSSQWLHSSVVERLHWDHNGHRFKSRWSMTFVQAFLYNCEDLILFDSFLLLIN